MPEGTSETIKIAAEEQGLRLDRVLTARIPALFKIIEQRAAVPVEILNPFKAIEIDNRKFDPGFIMDVAPVAAVAVGLALRKAGDKFE